VGPEGKKPREGKGSRPTAENINTNPDTVVKDRNTQKPCSQAKLGCLEKRHNPLVTNPRRMSEGDQSSFDKGHCSLSKYGGTVFIPLIWA